MNNRSYIYIILSYIFLLNTFIINNTIIWSTCTIIVHAALWTKTKTKLRIYSTCIMLCIICQLHTIFEKLSENIFTYLEGGQRKWILFNIFIFVNLDTLHFIMVSLCKLNIIMFLKTYIIIIILLTLSVCLNIICRDV